MRKRQMIAYMLAMLLAGYALGLTFPYNPKYDDKMVMNTQEITHVYSI